MKVVVFGNSGAGKTTVIAHIRKQLDIEVLSIDNFRRSYGDGTETGEQLAREMFYRHISEGKDQLIECVGIGAVATTVCNKLSSFDELVLCLTILAPASLCKSRIVERALDVPFPLSGDQLDKFIDKVQSDFQNGSLNALPFNKKNTIFQYVNNIESDDPFKIAQIAVNWLNPLSDNTKMMASSSIEKMLSPEIQNYYAEDYYNFQRVVNNKNKALQIDNEQIGQILLSLPIEKTLVDIGAGNAQWFPFLSPRVNNYIAIDVNTTGLNLLPTNSKIKPITANVFELDFNSLTDRADNTILFSFFWSHFSDDAITQLLNKLSIGKNVIIIDSFWSQPLKDKHLIKDLKEVRRNTINRTRIHMPKRFFEREDVDYLAKRCGYKVDLFRSFNYWFIAHAVKA